MAVLRASNGAEPEQKVSTGRLPLLRFALFTGVTLPSITLIVFVELIVFIQASGSTYFDAPHK